MMISKTWRARAGVSAAECGRDRNQQLEEVGVGLRRVPGQPARACA